MDIIMSMHSYKPWSGAVDTYNRLEKCGKIDAFFNMLECLGYEQITETAINDILWFESQWVFETLDISNTDEEDDEV